MKTQVKLNSTVMHGVGTSSETGALELIYAVLLREYKQNQYRYISIKQIGDDLNELILKDGKEIYCNIKYPVDEDFEKRSEREKNLTRLDVIHSALLRIAEYDKKLDQKVMQEIKDEIISKDFYFEFGRPFNVEKNQTKVAIIVVPKINSFDYYLSAKKDETELCRILIYKGSTSLYYYNYFFKNGKWKNINEFVIWGTQKQIKIHFYIDECKLEYENLTPYSKAPLFEMMRSDITEEEKNKFYNDWKDSLPPSQGLALDIKPN